MVGEREDRRDVWKRVKADSLDLYFQVPMRFVLLTEFKNAEHIALGVPFPDGKGYVEIIETYRYRPGRGEAMPLWRADIDALANAQGWQQLEVGAPMHRAAGGHAGDLAPFRCYVPTRDKWIVGAVWTATVAGDHVAVIYRCGPELEEGVSNTMDGILEGLTVMAPPLPHALSTPPITIPAWHPVHASDGSRPGTSWNPWRNLVGGVIIVALVLGGASWVVGRAYFADGGAGVTTAVHSATTTPVTTTRPPARSETPTLTGGTNPSTVWQTTPLSYEQMTRNTTPPQIVSVTGFISRFDTYSESGSCYKIPDTPITKCNPADAGMFVTLLPTATTLQAPICVITGATYTDLRIGMRVTATGMYTGYYTNLPCGAAGAPKSAPLMSGPHVQQATLRA